MNFASPEYWADYYEKFLLTAAPSDDPVRIWLEKYVPPGEGTCLEVGCFPGRYLPLFGKLGYRLFGVDTTSRVLHDLPQWLESQGHRVGEFYREDFLTFDKGLQGYFDVVYSVGFIEHFDNWQEMLDHHTQFVKKGGLLLISVPNFAGVVQRVLHLSLDIENLKRHVIPSMDPNSWQQTISGSTFNTIFCGYHGAFDFWVDSEMNFVQKVCAAAVRMLCPLLRFLPPRRSYAPHCGLVAIRVD